MRTVERPSTSSDKRPAANGVRVRFLTNLSSVHGSVECLLSAMATPAGLSGLPTTVTLVLNSSRSVSSTGIASENGLPLCSLSLSSVARPPSWSDRGAPLSSSFRTATRP